MSKPTKQHRTWVRTAQRASSAQAAPHAPVLYLEQWPRSLADDCARAGAGDERERERAARGARRGAVRGVCPPDPASCRPVRPSVPSSLCSTRPTSPQGCNSRRSTRLPAPTPRGAGPEDCRPWMSSAAAWRVAQQPVRRRARRSGRRCAGPPLCSSRRAVLVCCRRRLHSPSEAPPRPRPRSPTRGRARECARTHPPARSRHPPGCGGRASTMRGCGARMKWTRRRG